MLTQQCVFSAAEVCMIKNGKITYSIKGAALTSNEPDLDTHVSMMGNDWC